MSKLTPLLVLALIVISCKESRVCNHNGTDIPCGYYDLYTNLSDIESKINASFDDDVYMSFEDSYALREQWMALYTSKRDSLEEAFNLVDASAQFSMMEEMRPAEMEYFKKQKEERAMIKDFLSQLSITAEKVDTSFWEGGTPMPYLMWTITNNSDSTFGSLQIERHIKADGKIISSESVSYLFSKEQISPIPGESEDAIVKPGASVVLSFKTSNKGEISPEITGIGFVSKK